MADRSLYSKGMRTCLFSHGWVGLVAMSTYKRLGIISLNLLGSRDYHIGSNFRKFYLIRTGFTLGEPVSLVKVFRLVRLDFFGVRSVDAVGRCTTSYLLAGPVCL
jgi:hypothetical protein